MYQYQELTPLGTVTRNPGVDERIPLKVSKIRIRSLPPFFGPEPT
jgi:hypothetical protein